MSSLPPPVRVNDLPVLVSIPLPDSGGSYPGHLVLCDRGPDGPPDRYVTWLAYSMDSGKSWAATSGHYHYTVYAARADLERRAAKA